MDKMSVQLFINANDKNSKKDQNFLYPILFKCSNKDITLYVNISLIFDKIPYIHNMIYNLEEQYILEDEFNSDIVRKLIYYVHGVSLNIYENTEIIVLMDKWCIDIYKIIDPKTIYNLVLSKDKNLITMYGLDDIINEYVKNRHFVFNKIILMDNYVKFLKLLIKCNNTYYHTENIRECIKNKQLYTSICLLEDSIERQREKYGTDVCLDNLTFEQYCVLLDIYSLVGFDSIEDRLHFIYWDITQEQLDKMISYTIEKYPSICKEMISKLFRYNICKSWDYDDSFRNILITKTIINNYLDYLILNENVVSKSREILMNYGDHTLLDKFLTKF